MDSMFKQLDFVHFMDFVYFDFRQTRSGKRKVRSFGENCILQNTRTSAKNN